MNEKITKTQKIRDPRRDEQGKKLALIPPREAKAKKQGRGPKLQLLLLKARWYNTRGGRCCRAGRN